VITPVNECVEEPLTEQKDQEDLVPTYEVPEPPSPPVNRADSSTMKFFIGIVILVVLLCVGAVTFMYYPDLLDRMSTPSTEKVADEKVEKPAVPVALTDSIVRKDTTTVVAKKDTVAEVVIPKVVEEPKPVAKQETPATAPKKETKKAAATPFEPDSVNYKIVGTKATHTIQEGETLTKVALRFYGTKALWPYIVKYNSGVIKNPDHVPYGTVIKIPELEKK
jgi:LysM repeat protein